MMHILFNKFKILSVGPAGKKNALSLSVNVFSTKALLGDTIFGTAILRGHPSHEEV